MESKNKIQEIKKKKEAIKCLQEEGGEQVRFLHVRLALFCWQACRPVVFV